MKRVVATLLLFAFSAIGLVALVWLRLLRIRRIENETGVRIVGRDELTVDIGNRRYFVFAEMSLGGPMRVVATESVRDISDSRSIHSGVDVDSSTKAEVIDRVRLYFGRRGITVEYR